MFCTSGGVDAPFDKLIGRGEGGQTDNIFIEFNFE